jgi:hypothetical protein
MWVEVSPKGEGGVADLLPISLSVDMKIMLLRRASSISKLASVNTIWERGPGGEVRDEI